MSPEKIAEQIRTEGKIAPVALDTIAVIGLGYVGLPLAILAAEREFQTIGFDIDKDKTARLQRKSADFLSEQESETFQKTPSLQITHSERDLDIASVFIICVPTPVHEDHEPDLLPLQSASEIVGRHLKKNDLVIIESTVNPGVCEGVSLPILESASGLSRDNFNFAHCPERINPGDPAWNVRTIARVIGGRTNACLERAANLYRDLIGATILPMQSIKEAEAVKMVENSFRDINIAFVNELAMAFDKAGIDVVNVIKGASSKPFAFMAHYPGCGVGGHCIPVDPYYLIRYGADNGFEHKFLATARAINERMPLYTIERLKSALAKEARQLSDSAIALLGLAYKKDVPDVRESPALVIEKLLVEAGARVQTYDPYISRSLDAKTLDEAMRGATVALIATDHSVFRKLTPEDFARAGITIVIDGRNCLHKDAFKNSPVRYVGIGRT